MNQRCLLVKKSYVYLFTERARARVTYQGFIAKIIVIISRYTTFSEYRAVSSY